MISSYRNNRILRRKVNHYRNKKTYIKVSYRKNIDLKKATKEELRQIREKVIQQRKRENWIHFGVWVFAIGVFTLLYFAIF